MRARPRRQRNQRKTDMPSDISGWVEIIRAVFAGLKDLALVAVSCFSIYIQADVRSNQDKIEAKVDTQTAKVDAAGAKAEAAVTKAEAAVSKAEGMNTP